MIISCFMIIIYLPIIDHHYHIYHDYPLSDKSQIKQLIAECTVTDLGERTNFTIYLFYV